jgi:hypothetical protein
MQQRHESTSEDRGLPAVVLALAGFLMLAGGVWIVTTGDIFDGRHLLGSLLALIGGTSALVQALARAPHTDEPELADPLWDRVHTGTWRRPADGVEIWVGWLPARQMFVIGGACQLLGIQPGLIGRVVLEQVLDRAQAQGWRPTVEDGTQAVVHLMAAPNRRIKS